VFSEVFLVQIYQNFGKYIPKFIFKAKKTSENAFRSLKLGAKMEIRGGKRVTGGGMRKFRCTLAVRYDNDNGVWQMSFMK
jgi:hypothetical protein